MFLKSFVKLFVYSRCDKKKRKNNNLIGSIDDLIKKICWCAKSAITKKCLHLKNPSYVFFSPLLHKL